MRELFQKQLEQLHTLLIEMGALCEQVIERTYLVLMAEDKKAAAEIMEKDEIIDMKEREIEDLCLKILLQQQPVASDLRRVSAALKMITDMERIGDQASDIAEIIKTSNLKAPAKEIRLNEMAKATMQMVKESIDSFVKQDLEIAQKVIKDDDIVDNLFLDVRGQIASGLTDDLVSREEQLDLLMIAKYYERIGDHATNIAEWVEFSILGQHVEEE
ncbi:phosphate signaling complex protein PhoU [Blautia liquoris]|uniref:Phosphate-specific transport system accessory protein PhoU n=2 Tax=Blautia liquoris TaxID=2779518 RepID=A0A7M2RND4_9FIRM|nr:phosphate signaling complex protein PhoU [Blautia liquoris]